MNRRRTRRLLLGYVLAGSVLLSGLLGLSLAILQSEERAAEERRAAAIDERLRLALWRLDAAVVPWLAFLATQPPGALERAATTATALPAEEKREATAREEISPGRGAPSSEAASPPLVMPATYLFGAATGEGLEPQKIAPEAVLPDDLESLARHVEERLGEGDLQRAPRPPPNEANQVSLEVESSRRNWQTQANLNNMLSNGWNGGVRPGPFVPVFWPGPETARWLVLARRVVVGDPRAAVEAALVDREVLARSLLPLVEDLLPNARLVPVPADEGEARADRLATLPFILEPGSVPLPAGETSWPSALLLAWGAILLALLLAAAVLVHEWRFGARNARLAAVLTHELRTPVTTLKLHAELLREDMHADAAARRKSLEAVEAAAARLEGVVESVLLEARLEETRGGAQRRRRPLREVVEEAVDGARACARAADFGWNVELDLKDHPTTIDPRALGRILTALVENATRHARAARKEGVRLHARTSGGRLEIEVADRGPGIPPARARRLFEPWHRGGEGDGEGLGLGLSIARGLARALGGELRLLPAERGARFALSLPLGVGDGKEPAR